MNPAHAPAHTDSLLVRLHRIEGQLRGVQRMVEDGAAVVDILTQVASVRGALAGFGLALVDRELARVAHDAPPAELARVRDCVGLLVER